MKVLFLTDSLGYPRVDSFGTSASDVWTYGVRDRLFELDKGFKFFFDMKPYRDTRSLLVDVKNHCLSYQPDLIILQVGIVDCYPRALKRIEHQVLSRLPIIRNITKMIVKKNYTTIVRHRDIAYIPMDEYKRNLVELKALFPNAHWIVLPIAPACNEYIQKNPLINSRVKSYNSLQEEVFECDFKSKLYLDCDLTKAFLEDNHHLSKFGHAHVMTKVLQAIVSYETKSTEGE